MQAFFGAFFAAFCYLLLVAMVLPSAPQSVLPAFLLPIKIHPLHLARAVPHEPGGLGSILSLSTSVFGAA
jgi:hypothetical protein